MHIERIDSLEKFRAMTRKVVPPESAQDPDRAAAGNLNWGADDGKWLKLFGGEPNEENFWMWRELIREIQRDEDKQVCFADQKWANPLHFVHISEKDPMKVAYVPDAEKGKRDIYVVSTVGRYLTKYYGEERLTALEIREWANKHRERWLEQQVQFTETADDCERVYTQGPSSCMSHSASHLGLTKHPARVYAGPDTAIAYLTRDRKITARAVVNKHTKQYARLYGDELLATKLAKLGYSQRNHALDGAKLKYIEFKQGKQKSFLLPYIDGAVQEVDIHTHDNKTYLLVTDGGAYDANGTTGYARLGLDETFICDRCDEATPLDDAVAVYGDRRVCPACSESYINAIVDYDGERELVHADHVVSTRDDWYHYQLDLTRFGLVYNTNTDTWVAAPSEEEAPTENQQAA